MKCVGIQQLEAMRELMEAGEKLERTVFISFQPDEEIGGRGDNFLYNDGLYISLHACMCFSNHSLQRSFFPRFFYMLI